jgi:RNA polymerase sigma-70 factor (ECF subfamily)
MSDPLNESIRLIERYRADDSQAATELFQRYVARLTALVRARMSPKLAQRFDPEDVVQSAYRTFFARAKEGEFELKRGGDLWRLLAAITIHKLGKQIERHVAAKRAIGAEQRDPSNADRPFADSPSTRPSAEDEAMLHEEVEQLMCGLDESQCQMLWMRLAGYRLEEIAAETQRSERTVRRLLDKVRDRMQGRLNSFG